MLRSRPKILSGKHEFNEYLGELVKLKISQM